jgi:SNF2 family DNA or RNA helicase
MKKQKLCDFLKLKSVSATAKTKKRAIAKVVSKARAPKTKKVPVVNLPLTSDVTPQEHQKKVVDALNDPKTHGILVFHGLGTGKTITSILAAQKYLVDHPGSNCIVVLSASVREQFGAEIKRVVGATHPRFAIVSRERFLKMSGTGHCCSGKDVLIVDEVHNLRNPGKGKMTAAVKKCAMDSAKVILLSATPLVNSVAEIANLLTFFRLPSGATLPSTDKKFFEMYGDVAGGTKNPSELIKKIKGAVSYHMNPKDGKDFPKTGDLQLVDVQMTPAQELAHFSIMSKDIAKIRSTIEGDSKLSALTAFLQKPRIVCNYYKTPSGVVHMPKIQKMGDDITKAIRSNKRCIAYSQYIEYGITPLKKIFNSKGISYVEIVGGMSDKDKQEAVKKYNNGSVKLILISKAGGEGLDLKETDEIHVLEPHFNYAALDQVFGRGIRFQSHKNPNTVVKRFVYITNYSQPFINSKAAEIARLVPSGDDYLMWATADELLWWLISEGKRHSIEYFISNVIIPASI